MKISKVNHIKSAVVQKSDIESTGFIYVDPSKPGETKNTKDHIQKRVEQAKRLHERTGDKGIKYIRGDKQKTEKGKDKFSITGEHAELSIRNQNLPVQPDENGVLVPSVIRSVKGDSRNQRDKEALRLFLCMYADLDEDMRNGLLIKLRRLVILFFFGIDAVPQDDFDVWVDHKNRSTEIENYVEHRFVSDNSKRNEQDLNIKELRYKVRGKGLHCFGESKEAIEDNNNRGLFFDRSDLNVFWIGYIQKTVEKIFKLRIDESTAYKLHKGWISEKVWKGILNFICQKYISIGKAVYHTAMVGLLEGKTDSIGEIGDLYKYGINSFEYEIIKAEEAMQLDTSMYVAFAISHFANAVAEMPVGKEANNYEDILAWDIITFEKYKKNCIQRSLLQYFGGKSQWEGFSPVWEVSENDLFECFRIILSAVRNENFHFATANKNKGEWDTDLIGEMFRYDAERYSRIQINKYYSNNLPMFYKAKDIGNVINALYKSIANRNTQVPSFNSVFVRKNFSEDLRDVFGIRQNPKMTTEQIEKWHSALYYLFKEAYYNLFLESEDALALFYQTVENGLKGDNERAKQDFIKRIREIKPYKYTMSEICQMITTEQNMQNQGNMKKKSSYAAQKQPEIFQHYRVLLFQALKHSFVRFLMENKDSLFGFIKDPGIHEICDISEFLLDVQITKYDPLVNLVKETPELQKWYIITRLLSPKQSNFLIGSMRHYKQFLFDVIRRAKETGNALLDTDDKMNRVIDDIISVMDMCVGLSGTTSNNITDYFDDEEDYAQYASRFLDYYDKTLGESYHIQLSAFCNSEIAKGNRVGLFYDGKNPILNRNILMTKLYGASSIITDIVRDNRVTEKDLKELFDLEMEIEPYKLKGKCATKEQQIKLKKFQNKKNRVEFSDIEELSEIVDELQGRLIKWVFFRERDLMYFQLGFHYTCLHNDNCQKPDMYKQIMTDERVINNAILYQIVAIYINGLPVYYRKDGMWNGEEKAQKSAGAKASKFFEYTKNCVSENKYLFYESGLELFEVVDDHDQIIEFRNYIEHFKYYTSKDRSMLSMYSEIFDRFFTHDMKFRKNAVNLLYNILLGHFVKSAFVFGSSGGENEKKHVCLDLKKNGISSDEFTYKLDDGKKNSTMNYPAKDKHFLENVVRILYYPEPVPEGVVRDPDFIKIKVEEEKPVSKNKGFGKKTTSNSGSKKSIGGDQKKNKEFNDKSNSGFTVGRGVFDGIDVSSLPKG